MSISVEQARQVLGEEFNEYSDEEIQKVLDDLYYLANSLYDNL